VDVFREEGGDPPSQILQLKKRSRKDDSEWSSLGEHTDQVSKIHKAGAWKPVQVLPFCSSSKTLSQAGKRCFCHRQRQYLLQGFEILSAA
jgi:hypothetical protein